MLQPVLSCPFPLTLKVLQVFNSRAGINFQVYLIQEPGFQMKVIPNSVIFDKKNPKYDKPKQQFHHFVLPSLIKNSNKVSLKV